MSYLSYAKDFQGVAEVFLRDPVRYRPLLQFIQAVMTSASALTKAERELLAAHVSKLNGCGFCLEVHKSTLTAMGIDSRVIGPLEEVSQATGADNRLSLMIDFATKLTRTPDAVDQADIDTLRGKGWSEQSIEDAINVIGLFNYVNRLVDAFGIKGNEAYFKFVGRTLASQGYAPLIESTLKAAG